MPNPNDKDEPEKGPTVINTDAPDEVSSPKQEAKPNNTVETDEDKKAEAEPEKAPAEPAKPSEEDKADKEDEKSDKDEDEEDEDSEEEEEEVKSPKTLSQARSLRNENKNLRERLKAIEEKFAKVEKAEAEKTQAELDTRKKAELEKAGLDPLKARFLSNDPAKWADDIKDLGGTQAQADKAAEDRLVSSDIKNPISKGKEKIYSQTEVDDIYASLF